MARLLMTINVFYYIENGKEGLSGLFIQSPINLFLCNVCFLIL